MQIVFQSNVYIYVYVVNLWLDKKMKVLVLLIVIQSSLINYGEKTGMLKNSTFMHICNCVAFSLSLHVS